MSEHQEGMPGVVRTSLWLLGIFVALMIGLTIFSSLTARPSSGTAIIGSRSHSVLIVRSPQAQYQGLSGKSVASLGAEGMYFPFYYPTEQTFVMRGMLFPLDFVWVRDGQVVKTEENVPAPVGNEEPKFIYSKPEKVDGVFEFPAGFINRNSVIIGETVQVR